MRIMDIFKKTFLSGYATSDINIITVFICIICTTLLSAYIFTVYKTINKNSFYNKNFNLSLMGMAIITSAVILTIQSNIVVSLGMVGALSIVRFRTAIKDPMDLVFLFWSISVGIICGAGFAMIAVIASLGLTAVIILFSSAPDAKGNLILVVNTASHENEKEIISVIDSLCKYYKVRARNVTKTNMNMAVEIKTDIPSEIIKQLMELDFVITASVVEHDGDVTA